MRVHLWNWHVRDTVVILEKGNLTHPRFPLCDMLVTWKDLNGKHRRIEQCNQGAERNRRKLAAEEERGVPTRDFSAYGIPLEMVTYFKYLAQVILAVDNDWPAVMNNFYWARVVWRRMSHILSREGIETQVSGFF